MSEYNKNLFFDCNKLHFSAWSLKVLKNFRDPCTIIIPGRPLQQTCIIDNGMWADVFEGNCLLETKLLFRRFNLENFSKYQRLICLRYFCTPICFIFAVVFSSPEELLHSPRRLHWRSRWRYSNVEVFDSRF